MNPPKTKFLKNWLKTHKFSSANEYTYDALKALEYRVEHNDFDRYWNHYYDMYKTQILAMAKELNPKLYAKLNRAKAEEKKNDKEADARWKREKKSKEWEWSQMAKD